MPVNAQAVPRPDVKGGSGPQMAIEALVKRAKGNETSFTPTEWATILCQASGNDKKFCTQTRIAHALNILYAESSYGSNVSVPGGSNPEHLGPYAMSSTFGTAGDRLNAWKSSQIFYRYWLVHGDGGFQQAWDQWEGANAWPAHQAENMAPALAGINLSLKHQATASDVAGSVTGAIGNAVGAVTDPIAGIVSFLSKLFDASTWLTVGKALLGFTLLVLGFITLMKVLTGVDVAKAVPKPI